MIAREAVADSWQLAIQRLHPIPNPSSVNHPDIHGKVIAGYQGWFGAKGDGSGLGWRHYGGGDLGPGNCTFEMWPSTTEMGDQEKYPTPFRYEDGSVAHLFSSYHPDTVDRHFAWMQEYGIDGVMLQRFGTNLRSPQDFDFCTAVMDHVRTAAVKHGRSWAVMYDLSGMNASEVVPLIEQDWQRLLEHAKVTDDPGYLHDHGKPLIALWGVGFSDGRDYGLKECAKLIDDLKSDPIFGGNAIMLGVPYFWRDGNRDAVSDSELKEVLAKADIISPWAVGRYRGSAEVSKVLPDRIGGDLKWCAKSGCDYLPVIFPGFSWHNLQKSHGQKAELNAIDRESGKFLWQQAVEAKRSGADMLYVAMFDEVDEGTAIFKVSAHTPVGDSPFVSYGDLPEDHYLWLTGEIGKMLRGEIPVNDDMPAR
ncbi:xylosidase/arabinosidase [Luteolibacter pohnpeiensis]|uniref:Xylosidase/arabinosidase n=1 Tax=Luteolibacter pohnpeiensis TaxID=454153 RepID=A0A934VPJ6_9BACT|nr:glycoside hydrolase family 71/99-like protein [Luteolibacter pohnpeiensis]MBK1881076.1 xylosidase/arabinosidase [Luteolibacter pohnpeiensis]